MKYIYNINGVRVDSLTKDQRIAYSTILAKAFGYERIEEKNEGLEEEKKPRTVG